MFKRIIAVVAALALSLALVAGASASTDTFAKLKSFSYSASSKTGKLKAGNGKGTFTYLLTKSTGCGYSTGQNGGPMSCKKLTSSADVGKTLRITWARDAKHRRVASLIVLQING